MLEEKQDNHKVFIIFPVHIFKETKTLEKYDEIILFEEPTYFTKQNFHKLKLMYHRATLKFYSEYLTERKFKVQYKEYTQDIPSIIQDLKKHSKNLTIGCYDPVDHSLNELLNDISHKENFKLEIYENKQFLCTNKDLQDFLSESEEHHTKKKYTHDSSFYRWQRRRLNILMGKDGKDPSHWTYDTENRKPFHPSPKIKVPILPKLVEAVYIKEAKDYVEKNFKNNVGQSTHFIYPIDFESSDEWLEKFLEKKLDTFGPYQDAVHSDYPFMFHAILSPMMNIGLLTAPYIVKRTMQYYTSNPKIPIQSVEGFIRQIIGWREYVRMLYVFEGEKQRTCNFFNHHKKLNQNWYGKGGLGIKCIDELIQKVDKYGYLHHIERLMYIGNFMLLCGMHPDESYKWFMEYFIDSYDWVMVPNTYGMSQHADGGLMMTRPYFSSSNYIIRMSSYKKGPTLPIGKKEHDWADVFDALYYHFIDQHEEKLRHYYATSRNVAHWEHKSKENQQQMIKLAEDYIDQYIDTKTKVSKTKIDQYF